MNACELNAIVMSVSNAIIEQINSDKWDLLGSIFNQIGDSLSTAAAFCDMVNADKNSATDSSSDKQSN